MSFLTKRSGFPSSCLLRVVEGLTGLIGPDSGLVALVWVATADAPHLGNQLPLDRSLEHQPLRQHPLLHLSVGHLAVHQRHRAQAYSVQHLWNAAWQVSSFFSGRTYSVLWYERCFLLEKIDFGANGSAVGDGTGEPSSVGLH
jgi:hypothetical protein